jgi:hypothetical protein
VSRVSDGIDPDGGDDGAGAICECGDIAAGVPAVGRTGVRNAEQDDEALIGFSGRIAPNTARKRA